MSEENVKCPKCGALVKKGETFCGNCGTKIIVTEEEVKSKQRENYNIKWKKPFVSFALFDLIGYICLTLILGAVLSSVMFGCIDGMEHAITDIGENVFQQLYNATQSVGLVLGIAIAVTAGIALALAFICVTSLNVIQRRIVDTQDLLDKQFKIINERFNAIEDKK